MPSLPWRSGALPFRFTYGGVASDALLPAWERTEKTTDTGRVVEFFDPRTALRVTCEIRSFARHDAEEWVIFLANEGAENSLRIENIQPLSWQVEAGAERSELHYALGSEIAANDFENRSAILWAGSSQRLSSAGGRSSRNHLPFFNLQAGDGGFIGAVGWTGNWAATFERDETGCITLEAGMPRTRLVLHPGEKIRTPRILLLRWEGDRGAGHNAWRRLILEHYSPQQDGRAVTVPAFYTVWGTTHIDRHLERVERLAAAEIPVEVYWIDAGWYGRQPLVENATVFNTGWSWNRGNWWPSKECYPQGLEPLGRALAKHDLGFLLWLEPEVADSDSDLLAQHPDWFLQPDPTLSRILDLGNPEARARITDIVSKLVTEAGLTWYRQDFNIDPEKHWNGSDAPDRVGMTEIRYIEGLYAFWDALHERHPGLFIDNCSSGGRRIDLETLSRSVPLWRSDYQCNPDFEATGSQCHTTGLAPWVPLSAGVINSADTYALRSCYSAGLVIESGMCHTHEIPDEWLKNAVEEFREVRAYCQGDYHLLEPCGPFDIGFLAWQFFLPERKAGVAIVLRRRHGPEQTYHLKLQGIAAGKDYEVEVRTEFGRQPAQIVEGARLGEGFPVAISAQPGSALVFYKELN